MDRCRTTLRAVAVALLLLAPAATASADDAHYQFDLSVDAPASTGDPFRVQVTETLVGAKPAVKVSIVYEIVVVDPNGAERVLQGPVSETNGLGAELQHITIRYWPRQNGEFSFRVVQLDRPTQTVLAERRLTTDKVPVLALDAPPTTPQSGGEFAVTGLRTDPVPAGCWRAGERSRRRREFRRGVSDANRARALCGRYRAAASRDRQLHARSRVVGDRPGDVDSATRYHRPSGSREPERTDHGD